MQMPYNGKKLGFGLMRLPTKNDEIDIPEVCNMVDSFMQAGYTYFDTAYVYHGGESETALKAALVNRYPRESFQIATKMPIWEAEGSADVQRIFDEQLTRTGAGYFDYYLLHSIEGSRTQKLEDFGCWEWGQKMKQQGLIRHFGFSFHDSPEVLDEVLTAHPEVEFVQLQINYADWENPTVQSGGCYEVARRHGVPIILMEPVKGGTLAQMKPKLEAQFDAAVPGSSPASWAMRFCLGLEGVMVILSGMSTPAQLADNLSTFENYRPFTAEEKAVLEKVKQEYLKADTVPCTSCRYCVDGCPVSIDIPSVFNAHNAIITYGDHFRPRAFYGNLPGGRAADCLACAACEGVCPQHLPIVELLQKSSEVFDKKTES